MFSFKYTPRNFVKNFPFIGALSVCNGGEIFCKTFLILKEQNKQYFVLEIFKETLLALNQVVLFLSSLLIVSKRFSMSKSETNKCVPSANIIGISLRELLEKSFMYMRNKVVQEWDPAVHHKQFYGLCYFPIYLVIQTISNVLKNF